MRIAFAGTPAFAATGLEALLAAGFEICVVLSQPDRPAGRGMQRQPGAVARIAQARALPLLTPASLRPERGGAQTVAALEQLRAARPDVLVVAAYGLLLPEAVLQIPRGLPLGDSAGAATALNIHASLLPRWRGAAPIVRAIEAGDRQTGISIMQMDAGLDTGPILLTEAVDIAPEISAGVLTAQLAALGAKLIVAALEGLRAGQLRAHGQPSEGVAYAHKVNKREAWINWQRPAHELAARIRAFDPFPGACSNLAGQTIKCWRSHVLPVAGLGPRAAVSPAISPVATPGTVLAAGPEGIVVACGTDALCLTQLQRPGARRLDAREFLAGTPVAAGLLWSTPAELLPAPPG
jgi:methionyl-tRNA formyltransferase